MRQSPAPVLTVCWVNPVPAPLATTVTPGNTAPLGSVTVPVKVPVGLPCPCAGAGATSTTHAARNSHAMLDVFIRLLPTLFSEGLRPSDSPTRSLAPTVAHHSHADVSDSCRVVSASAKATARPRRSASREGGRVARSLALARATATTGL